MKHYSLISFLLALLLITGTNLDCFSQKVQFELTDNGAWAINSEPSAVYHNGKTYFAWITKEGAIEVASYEHSTGNYIKKALPTGAPHTYKSGTLPALDYGAPSILVRNDGKIVIFAPSTHGEHNTTLYMWLSTDAGDITSWGSRTTAGTLYGANTASPFKVGSDVVVFARTKDNFNAVFLTNLNTTTTTLPTTNTRPGLFNKMSGTGNALHQKREQMPFLRAIQDESEAIHLVFSQIEKGLLTYAKFERTGGDGSTTFKLSNAAGSEISTMPYNDAVNSAIYEGEIESKKAWAYDITLLSDGTPVVLYATFNTDGTEHEYYYASWNSTEEKWVSSKIATIGEGVSRAAHSFAYSPSSGTTYTIAGNSYSSGGLTFGSDLSTVYLSKKGSEADDTFEIYKYSTSDNGQTWAEEEAITSSTPSDIMNIRPIRVKNKQEDDILDMNVVWMRGAYTGPNNFSTSIVLNQKSTTVSVDNVTLDKETLSLFAGGKATLQATVLPALATNKNVTWSSGTPAVATVDETTGEITALTPGTATITVTTEEGNKTATCTVTVTQRPIDWFFDFGMPDVAPVSGAIRVADVTSFAENGTFGWLTKPVNSRDRSSAGETDPLKAHLVYGTDPTIFKTKLDNGFYHVEIMQGDYSYERKELCIKANGEIVAEGINIPKASYVTNTFFVNITNETLDIEFSKASTTDWGVNSIKINLARTFNLTVPQETVYAFIKGEATGGVEIPLIKTGDNTYTAALLSSSEGQTYNYYTLDANGELLVETSNERIITTTPVTDDTVASWTGAPKTGLPVATDGKLSITYYEASYYEASALNSIEELEVNGLVTAQILTRLSAALGSNETITNITFNKIGTDITSDYFAAINPNCLKHLPAATTEAPAGWKNVTTGSTALTDISLSDGYPFNCPTAITNANVTYTRNCYTDGGWETIVLPFTASMDKQGEYTIEEYNTFSNGWVKFSLVEDAFKANNAYIMKHTDATGAALESQTCTFTGQAVTLQTTAPAGEGFIGVYKTVPGKVGDINKYILDPTGTELRKGSSDSTVPPFRAFYLPESTVPGGNAPTFYVDHGNATGIGNNQSTATIYYMNGVLYIYSDIPASADIYGIDGSKMYTVQLQEGTNPITGLAKGIYIINNQKVTIY